MFAGEGTPEQTNRRFHYLSAGQPAVRLSTAFDSVTLYGEDPHPRPDIYGKVGNSGVSIATVDDAKRLYSGLRSLHAVDVGLDDDQRAGADHPRVLHERRGRPAGREAPARDRGVGRDRAAHRRRCSPTARGPRYRESLPEGHDGLGLGLLGVSGDQVVDRETYERIKAETLDERPRHGAGRHPQGGPGPEHVHLLDRVRDAGDGRRPGVLRRQRRAELLQRLDQRVPHRRGGGEPDLPARVHAGERVHDRRVLPRPRHGDRRLRAQPQLLLLATGWTPSTP